MNSLLRALFVVLFITTAAAGSDWLADADRTAREATIPGVSVPEKPKTAWVPYVPASRLFSGEIPVDGWWPMEDETATGSVFRLLGGDSQSGTIRTVLSVRFYDKDTPAFVPIKRAVDLMRRENKESGRSISPVRPYALASASRAPSKSWKPGACPQTKARPSTKKSTTTSR